VCVGHFGPTPLKLILGLLPWVNEVAGK